MHRVNEIPSLSRPLLQRISCWCLVFIATLIFFSILRAEFLAWNWRLFREQSWVDILWAFVFGLRFDISASLMLLAPWLLLTLVPGFSRLRKSSWLFILFIVIQFPFWALNFTDIEFINFVGRRFTASSLFLIREFRGGATQGLILPYGGWILFWLLQIFIYYKIIWRIWKMDFRGDGPVLPKGWIGYTVSSLVVLVLSIVGIRGGLQKKPLNFVHAHVFTTPMLNNLILNSSFTLFKSLNKDSLPRETFFSTTEEMQKYLNGSIQQTSLMQGVRRGQKRVDQKRADQKLNVVFLILESFALEYMGEVNHQKGFTPFLDELAKKSVFFTNAFANGRRSIEGIAAIYTGIPALMDEPFISSEFSSNYFIGLGTTLGQAGYHTSFFHGADNGSMYFDSFMKSAGVMHYFGRSQYPRAEDFDGAWGIFDEPFLQFFAQKLSSFPEPFFSGLFTLSSHTPYTIPTQYRSLFPPGPIEISASISYTDMALQKFFAEAEKQPWFERTLFVITADHTQINYLPQYNNILGLYRVPLIFYAPGVQWPAVDTTQPAQHIDIFPTVLDVLDIAPTSSVWFGRSLFVPGERTVTHYLEPGYLIQDKQHYLIWNRPLEPELFAMDDLKQLHPLPAGPEKLNLQNRLKATLQYFSQGLWDQKLYFPSK